MRREQEILDAVKPLSPVSKEKILEFIIGYMSSSNGSGTDGYVAFMEGMETAIITYRVWEND